MNCAAQAPAGKICRGVGPDAALIVTSGWAPRLQPLFLVIEMSHQLDNVRPLLLRDQMSRRRRHGRAAKVIPLHRHLHDPRLWQAVGYSVLATAMVALLVGMLAFTWRSGADFLGRLAPRWPWW